MFSSCNLYGEVLVIISAENVAFLGVKSGLTILVRVKDLTFCNSEFQVNIRHTFVFVHLAKSAANCYQVVRGCDRGSWQRIEDRGSWPTTPRIQIRAKVVSGSKILNASRKLTCTVCIAHNIISNDPKK